VEASLFRLLPRGCFFESTAECRGSLVRTWARFGFFPDDCHTTPRQLLVLEMGRSGEIAISHAWWETALATGYRKFSICRMCLRACQDVGEPKKRGPTDASRNQSTGFIVATLIFNSLVPPAVERLEADLSSNWSFSPVTEHWEPLGLTRTARHDSFTVVSPSEAHQLRVKITTGNFM